MAKLIINKSRSFTLIELLISVSIFVVVVVMVVAILSMTVSSRSKIQATDELRTEAGKVMAEIQDMVEKGNTTLDTTYFGVNIIDASGVPVGCSGNGVGLKSSSTDSKNINILKIIRRDGDNLKFSKTITGQPTVEGNINPAQLRIIDFQISGNVRRPSCSGNATLINVLLQIQGKTTGYVGAAPTITLQTTFTSKYPNPDKAGDSS